MRGTEGKRSVRWESHGAARCLLPSTASILAASRLFRFGLSKTPIPDHFCPIPVARNIRAEWKFLDRGGKVRETKIIQSK